MATISLQVLKFRTREVKRLSRRHFTCPSSRPREFFIGFQGKDKKPRRASGESCDKVSLDDAPVQKSPLTPNQVKSVARGVRKKKGRNGDKGGRFRRRRGAFSTAAAAAARRREDERNKATRSLSYGPKVRLKFFMELESRKQGT